MSKWKPAVSVVVVTYNSKNEINEFLETLSRQIAGNKLDIETIIIDNASKDGTRQFLQEVPDKFDSLKPKVIINDKNIGLSRALNQGTDMARGETLILCNPDIRFDDSLYRLIKASTAFPRLVICPELIGQDGVVQRAVYMRFPTRARIFMTHTIIGRVISTYFFPQIRDDFHYRYHHFRPPIDLLEQGAPVCMILTRPTLTRLSPLFDSKLPVFWNDVDLSMRARTEGVRFAIAPDIKIVHGLSHAIRKLDDETRLILFFSSAGLIGFLRKWKFSPRFFQAALFFDAVYMISLTVFDRAMRRSSDKESLRFAAHYWILRFRCSLR